MPFGSGLTSFAEVRLIFRLDGQDPGWRRIALRCPKCGSRSTGRIGQDQYYCWDCNVEFHVQGGSTRIYSIDLEGVATLESVRLPDETEIRPAQDGRVSFRRGFHD